MRTAIAFASIPLLFIFAAPAAADPITLDSNSTITVDTHNVVKAWFHVSDDNWYWFASSDPLSVNPACPCPVGSYVTSFMDLRSWGWGGAHLGDRVYDGLRLYARFYTPGDILRVERVDPRGMQPSEFSGFTGTLTAYQFMEPLFTAEFRGGGVFSFDREPRNDAPGVPVERAVYEFDGSSGSPIPEPASLLLVGAGVAATLRTIRSRRRQSSRQSI